MVMPAAVGREPRPIAAFTVIHDEFRDVYVMVYSPAPGFTDRVVIRASTTPVGPWTQPLDVWLPVSGAPIDGPDNSCYAGSAQPAFSDAATLGLGYFDRLTSPGSGCGQYYATTVPFAVYVAAG